MKMPEQFSIIIPCENDTLGKSLKYLLEEVPIEMTFAKSMYNGGRYSRKNKYIPYVFFGYVSDNIRYVRIKFKQK